ncbi:MAG: spermidine synthase [Chlamydiales bacterium]|jgi:spermidine synthase
MNSTAIDPASDAAPATGGRSRGTATFVGVAACFVLSGFAALLYQTAWMRQFSILFGTSELAIVSVLAAYMGGLALGSAIAGRLAHRVRRPVLVYGLLELGIAGGALLVPTGLAAANKLLHTFLGGQPAPPQADSITHSLFYVAATFAVILIPTTLMGATLPLLTRYAVDRASDIGRRVGILYALNTAGAVGGTLFAAFNLLPTAGLAGTVRVGVVVNFAVFVIAAVVARSAAARPHDLDLETVEDPAADQSDQTAEGATWERRVRWILPLILVSGLISFTYEVLWTRLVSHVLGGSVQAFATMLASFLVGITLGSAVASRFANTRRGSMFGFAMCQVGTAVMATTIYLSLDQFAGVAESLAAEGGGISSINKALLCAGVLLPATLCIGATFPFALRALARDERAAGLATGRVYAWNTSGAVVGALCAGFILVPGLGYAGTATFGALTNIALALAALWTLGKHRASIAVAAIGLLSFAPLVSGPPEKLLLSSPLASSEETGEPRIIFQAVGQSASVLMRQQGGRFFLRTNGLPESWVEPKGSPFIASAAAHWLCLLPVLARPAARNMLMVGFGGGVALEAVPPSIESVDCIELEPEVIEANRAIADMRLADPLADPRIEIIYNDARGALNLTSKRYDIIISQPSHPWTAGGSHLFTSEFAGQVREHLTDDGVFLQWMNTEFVDADLLRSMGTTLLAHYPYVRLYCIYPEVLMFLASDSPLNVEADIARTGEPLASHPDWYALKRIDMVEDVLVHLALEQKGLRRLCKGAPIITDDANLMAMRSAVGMEGWLNQERFGELLKGSDALLDRSSEVSKALGSDLDWIRVGRYMLGLGDEARAQRIAFRNPTESRRFLALGLIAQSKGDTEGAVKQLRRSIEIDPSDQDTQYLLASIYTTRPEYAELAADARAGLTGPHLATAEAHAFARKGEYDSVRKLDAQLAEARPRDIVYPIALQLRALWRCIDTERPLESAQEVIDLLARVRFMSDIEYRLRMRAAATLQDADMQVETASALVNYLTNRPGSPEEQAAATAALTKVQTMLAASEEGTRRAEVRDNIAEWIGSIASEQE